VGRYWCRDLDCGTKFLGFSLARSPLRASCEPVGPGPRPSSSCVEYSMIGAVSDGTPQGIALSVLCCGAAVRRCGDAEKWR
jgi:hypothetical protein